MTKTKNNYPTPKDQTALNASDEQTDLNLVLIGKIGERLICLPISEVKGIELAPPITKLPNSMPILAGLVYFRGGIEAAVDLRSILNNEPFTHNSATRAALIEKQGVRAVVLLDEIVDMPKLPLSKISYPTENQSDSLLSDLGFRWQDKEVILLSSIKLFNLVNRGAL